MAGVLPVDDDTIGRLRDLARRAARPDLLYRPGESAVPGDVPELRENVGTYKVVFSHTRPRGGGKVCRHMSISSTMTPNIFPAPHVVYTVAHWLGFTGARPDDFGVVHPGGRGDWAVKPDSMNGIHFVAVAEEIA